MNLHVFVCLCSIFGLFLAFFADGICLLCLRKSLGQYCTGVVRFINFGCSYVYFTVHIRCDIQTVSYKLLPRTILQDNVCLSNDLQQNSIRTYSFVHPVIMLKTKIDKTMI